MQCPDPQLVESNVLKRYKHKINCSSGSSGSREFIQNVDLTDILVTAAERQFDLPGGTSSRKKIKPPLCAYP